MNSRVSLRFVLAFLPCSCRLYGTAVCTKPEPLFAWRLILLSPVSATDRSLVDFSSVCIHCLR